MRRETLWGALLFCALTTAALGQTATVTLSSPQGGQIVPPGSAVNWQIAFTVSTGDNEGLALLSCDLTQNSGNPAFLDIPPADGVPTGMANFSRPGGISNPGETDPTTGYIGVQRGTPGQMDLIQIGGGQNTFGEALPPGTGVGENANVVGGVGQAGAETLASGSFAAPTTRGAYTFSLANSVANVLQQHNDPPDFSPVIEATVDTSAGSFGFTVTLAGDVDLDCDVDLSDLATLLSNYGELSGMTWADGDSNGDGDVDLSDLAALLANYTKHCP